MSKIHRRHIDEPVMSDMVLLVTVEDLIAGCFGSIKTNTVNFKLLESILHMLARQLRLLQHDVEVTCDDLRNYVKPCHDKTEKKSSPRKVRSGREKIERDDGRRRQSKILSYDRGAGIEKFGATSNIISAGTTAGSRVARVGSIEVVTLSQFALLEKTVQELMKAAGSPSMPSLPENEQLRTELAKGRASLSETMQAVQLNARVQAAEQGLSRMAELLTQLAAAGVLPVEVAARVGMMQAETQRAASQAKPTGVKDGGTPGRQDLNAVSRIYGGIAVGQKSGVLDTFTTGSGMTSESFQVHGSERSMGVTYEQMIEFISDTKEDMKIEIENLISPASYNVSIACDTSTKVAEKLDIVLKMNNRISTLYSKTADWANQLRGFDSGLGTQMENIEEQVAILKQEINGGLAMFETLNNNAETAALLALSERCQSILEELERTVQDHRGIDISQKENIDKVKGLFEGIEMLCEQKADRDEVLDGLRDKADLTRLIGLVQEKVFAQTRIDLKQLIKKSIESFNKLDEVWQNTLKDLLTTMEKKADLITLQLFKRSTGQELTNIEKKLQQLEVMLGEPKAAALMRKLGEGAMCGACCTRALAPPTDSQHGKPLPLPALRPAPSAPCPAHAARARLAPPDIRKHVCHRWVGGSHIQLARSVTREKPSPIKLQTNPTKKIPGYGLDGKMYRMEEALHPCKECNIGLPEIASQPPAPTDGGGDQGWH